MWIHKRKVRWRILECNNAGNCNFEEHWCVNGHWPRQSQCVCKHLSIFQNAKGIQMNFIEVQGTFLCTRWSTTHSHRNHFLCDVCTCCPVDYDQTIVYPEDSAWIEEQARWCKCNLYFPSCRSWNRWKRLCQVTPGIYSVFKEWSPKDSQIEECSLWTFPRAFWKYITEKLKACGLKQSKLIHVFSLEVNSSVLFTVTTLSSGTKTQWTSITQRYSYAG